MLDIAINETHPDTLFIAYFDMGIWRSFDGGESWQSCNDDIFTDSWNGQGGNCHTILSDPQRPNVVWAAQSENQNGEYPTYLIKNTQTGNRNAWTASNNGLPLLEINGLSLDRTSLVNNRTLYVTADDDVYKSTDDGVYWIKVFDCNGCRFTAVDPFNGQTIYTGGEKGVWRSDDGGVTWTDISHPDMKASLGANYWDYSSYDGVFDILPDPDQAGRLYVTAFGQGKGLYRSDDYGNTWTKILTDDFMRKVEVVKGYNHIIYATSSSAISEGGYDPNSNGVWFSDDEGQTWTQQNQGMAWPFALTVQVDTRTNPVVFVGSPGTGFQKSNIPNSLLSTHAKKETENIQIYPNPFKEKITINSEYSIYDIKVFDTFGKLVAKYEGESKSITIDLSSLTDGIYFLNVHQNIKNKGVYILIKH